MIDLGINIDHVATLRQQRHTTYPDPIAAALLAEDAGADLITLHLREDRRHIQDADVFALRPQLRTRMNLECAITAEMLRIACQVVPQDVVGAYASVGAAVKQLQGSGIRVSLFIDPESEQIRAAADAGATVIELHTGAYAEAASASIALREIRRLEQAIGLALGLGLRVNAGHGLHFGNVAPIAALEGIAELNIGHAIVAQAIFDGWENTIRNMKACMITARLNARRGTTASQ